MSFYIYVSFIISIYLHTSTYRLWTYLRHILNYNPHFREKSSPKLEPVQTGIKVCPQGIPVWTGLTVVAVHIVFRSGAQLSRAREIFYCVLFSSVLSCHKHPQ